MEIWRFEEVHETLWAGPVGVGEVGRRAACPEPAEGLWFVQVPSSGYNLDESSFPHIGVVCEVLHISRSR